MKKRSKDSYHLHNILYNIFTQIQDGSQKWKKFKGLEIKLKPLKLPSYTEIKFEISVNLFWVSEL